MPHVITQHCCNDAACTEVCPVDCIQPTPDSPDYASTEMLYIDPDVCIDCGACIDACPVDAIRRDYDLRDTETIFKQVNADYFSAVGSSSSPTRRPWHESYATPQVQDHAPTLSVAVVGAGASGLYATEALMAQTEVAASVDIFERLCTPGGLVRFGVAPDHLRTKAALTSFNSTMSRPGVRMFFNAQVGRDISHQDLSDRYHAVIYTVGAAAGKELPIPGVDLDNSVPAADFVAWFNGHPDHAQRAFDLSGHRAVVLGNGNVALDVARILASDPERLARTDIADHALAKLRGSKIREVVVVGRRGPADAAFTVGELIGLSVLPEVDIVVSGAVVRNEVADRGSTTPGELFSRNAKLRLLAELAARPAVSERRIVLRFLSAPARLLGDGAVTGVELRRNELRAKGDDVILHRTDDVERLDCGLVVQAVGYRGTPIEGVPFDEARGVLPNVGGRVTQPGATAPVPGVYAAGWIKRGPSGVIGTNKKCAAETVACILEDYAGGKLAEPVASKRPVEEQLPNSFGVDGARLIDEHEIATGRRQGRPRSKLVDRRELLAIARPPRRGP